MPSRVIKELRELSDAELAKMIVDNKSEMMKIRFKGKVEKLDNPMMTRNLRKKIARINTILKERAMKNESK